MNNIIQMQLEGDMTRQPLLPVVTEVHPSYCITRSFPRALCLPLKRIISLPLMDFAAACQSLPSQVAIVSLPSKECSSALGLVNKTSGDAIKPLPSEEAWKVAGIFPAAKQFVWGLLLPLSCRTRLLNFMAGRYMPLWAN